MREDFTPLPAAKRGDPLPQGERVKSRAQPDLRDRRELQPVARLVVVHLDRRAVSHVALEEQPRQRRLDLLLIVRFSGRAPYAGSYPVRTTCFFAASVRRIVIFRSVS